MQFHLNGYQYGDPDLAPALRDEAQGDGSLPETVDVLIVGCGPAGLTLAAQLARFPGITTRIVEQKSGPLQLGQADGIACRTMEMFQAFGFAERVLREAYWVNETSFWKPDADDRSRIVRGTTIRDTEEGLSEFPHVILNQARVHGFYLDVMRKSANRLVPDYERRIADLTVDRTAADHPVTVRLERVKDGVESGPESEFETVRARYLVGCDGARSAVRRLLGRELRGDSANQAWGVMDVLAVTDFPDIRRKAIIQSAEEGTIVLIPREGGYLVRIYVELDQLKENERVATRNITVDHLIAAAQRVFRPHAFEVKEVAWWSVYEIGQRLCDRFDDLGDAEDADPHPRVFIAGDACHTHSPKAGQGMNVSMQDTFNLGWKLAAVLEGRSAPSLLATYSQERQSIAKNLIDFDREWAAMLSMPLKTSESDETGIAPETIRDYFVQHGRYTAGTATVYSPSLLTGKATHQHLASGFLIGTRFHSAPVIRLADAKPMHLGHTVEADGRWRLFAFAGIGDHGQSSGGVAALCDFLTGDQRSPLRRSTTAGEDVDAVIDPRAVFQSDGAVPEVSGLPALLLPPKGRHGLRDYEKAFRADPGNDIFDLRGIDRARGALLIVRPDQYVAHVLPLDGYDELAAYFAGILLPRG